MKKLLFFTFALMFAVAACKMAKKATEVNRTEANYPAATLKPSPEITAPQDKVNYTLPETWILGYFTPDRFNRQPHSLWYHPGYDGYEYDESVVRNLLDLELHHITILVVVGTWCPDSRREVPRFMKILTAINFPSDKVKFLGVDNTKNAPVDNYESFGIQRVPTFIFYVKNIEAGRIIENPSTSLEKDMLNILSEIN